MNARADTIDAARCALVLVDFQAKLMPAIHGGAAAVRAAEALADGARLLGLRIVGTEQNPMGLGPNVSGIRERCDVTLGKMHFDACEDGLVAALDANGPCPDVVVAGCEAHVCLLQTALGLLRQGRRVWVVPEACGSRRASDHALAMQRLGDAGATRVSVEMVLFEWLRHSGHPRFKEILSLVKAIDLHPASPPEGSGNSPFP